MGNINCLKCSGDGKLANGMPCPDCQKVSLARVANIYKANAPRQYQGIVFNKDFVSPTAGKNYPVFLETLMNEIVNLGTAYCTNHLICSRIGMSKTIWAYTLLSTLDDKAISNNGIVNLVECKEILNSWDKSNIEKITKVKCLIVKLPRDLNSYSFDTIQGIIETRVINDGFTIFLFSGSEQDLEYTDKLKKLKYLKGNGSFSTIKIHSF